MQAAVLIVGVISVFALVYLGYVLMRGDCQ